MRARRRSRRASGAATSHDETLSPNARARRRFLAASTSLAAGAVLPAQSVLPSAITAGTVACGETLADIAFTGPERDQMLPAVRASLEHFQAMRTVVVPAGVEPAIGFRVPAGLGSSTIRSRKSSVRPAITWPGRGTGADDIAFAPAAELAERLRRREVTSTELTRLYLERTERFDRDLLCVVTLTKALALEQASRADEEIRRGRYRGPLHGLPYGLKDLIATRGIRTTWGAKPYEDQIPDHDATVYERLRDAGAVLIGKLSTGELALGDLWFGGRTRNPWQPNTGSGGSSAGPAAATAAGLVAFAIGTETNGSIMSPASVCGVTGLRPTYGRVSRHGVMALRWTLDKVGVMARSAADTALVLDAIHGPDGRDSSIGDVPFRWTPWKSIQHLRIGVVERDFAEQPGGGAESPTAPEQRRVFHSALEELRSAGARLLPVSLPDFPTRAMYATCSAEAAAVFDDLIRSGAVSQLADTTPDGRANQLRWAQLIPAVEYLRAQRLRAMLITEVQTLLGRVDVLVSPSHSESVTMTNFTGHPAISVNCGFVQEMPLGLMFTGRYYDEATIIGLAHTFQTRTTWHLQRPPRVTAS